jgi:hypothetical protein
VGIRPTSPDISLFSDILFATILDHHGFLNVDLNLMPIRPDIGAQ